MIGEYYPGKMFTGFFQLTDQKQMQIRKKKRRLINLNLWTGKQEYLATSVNALRFLGGIVVAVIGHLDLPSAKVKSPHYEHSIDCDPAMDIEEKF
jgi:hypothetical protein